MLNIVLLLAFTLAISVATALVFGVISALAVSAESAAGALVGFEAAVFSWIVGRRAGATVARLGPYDGTAAAYVDAVQRLAAWVDTYSKGDR